MGEYNHALLERKKPNNTRVKRELINHSGQHP